MILAETEKEHKHLTLLVTGSRTVEAWNGLNKTSDFFYLKGIAASLLHRLGISNYKEQPVKDDVISEGVTMSLGKINLVSIGLVKKPVLKHFDIAQPVLYSDFYWDNILEVVKRNSITFKDLPKYPEVRRDFALLVDEAVTFESVFNIAKQSERKLLKDVNLFDVYEGKNLPKGKKSYAVSFVLQDEHKTLTDKQIDKIMNKLQQSFEKELGAVLR